jgi:hypothetical protein
MADAPLEERVLKVCHEISRCDDSHGMYSDHEGDKDGPIWSLWCHGYKDFKVFYERAIADHKRAIFLWRKLQKLNDERAIAMQQAPKKV